MWYIQRPHVARRLAGALMELLHACMYGRMHVCMHIYRERLRTPYIYELCIYMARRQAVSLVELLHAAELVGRSGGAMLQSEARAVSHAPAHGDVVDVLRG